MSSAFVSNLTYTRKIGNAPDADVKIEDVESFVVELRPLDAGDRAAIRDSLAMELDAQGEAASVQARLGTIEILTVEKAVVDWTLTPGPSRATIGRLRPDVLEAIRDQTAWGKIPVPKPAEEADKAAERQPAGRELDELRRGDEEAEPVPPTADAAAGS